MSRLLQSEQGLRDDVKRNIPTIDTQTSRLKCLKGANLDDTLDQFRTAVCILVHVRGAPAELSIGRVERGRLYGRTVPKSIL